jgi:hypothetical protein
LLRHAHLQHIFAGNVFVVFCADFRLKAERFTKTGSGHAQKKRKEKKRKEKKRKEAPCRGMPTCILTFGSSIVRRF